jgi:hypothetical protein
MNVWFWGGVVLLALLSWLRRRKERKALAAWVAAGRRTMDHEELAFWLEEGRELLGRCHGLEWWDDYGCTHPDHFKPLGRKRAK